MEFIKSAAAWFDYAFRHQRLFRRGVIMFELFLVGFVTYLSYSYALAALDKGAGVADVLGIIGVLQAPVALLLGYHFKMYIKQREQENE